MLPTTNAYSSFAAKDIGAEKRFYAHTLGLDVNELYDGQLLELRLDGDKRVLIYDKPDFTPATWQAFHAVVLDGARPADAAAQLGLTVNAVFIAKSRVLRRLRQELRGLTDL